MPFTRVRSILRTWVRLSRRGDWLTSKLPYAGAAALLLNNRDLSALMAMGILVTVSAWAAFGFGVNEIADRKSDYRAGKRNAASSAAPTVLLLFIFVSCSCSLAFSFVWAKGPTAPSIVLIGLIFAAAYSLPPARIKERGFSGLLAGATAQWCFPVLAVAAATPLGLLHARTWCMALLSVAIGIRWMGIHQLGDVVNDRKSGVRTYVTTGGRAAPVIYGAFGAELILLPLTLIFSRPQSIPAAFGLALWILLELILIPSSDSLQKRLLSYDQAPLAEYYFLLFPLILAINRTREDRAFALLSAMFLIISRRYVIQIGRRCRDSISGRRPSVESPVSFLGSRDNRLSPRPPEPR